MRSPIALLMIAAALLAAAAGVPASAQVLSVETYMEQWDPAAQEWVRVDENAAPTAERFVAARARPAEASLAAYGPFRVLASDRAALVDVTDGRSPAHFSAMLRDYPGLAVLDMIECPGTEDDQANMKLGRMIRAAGIATHVPARGSVRSGAVELFLAGATRQVDDGAEFAVHSWLDDNGRQPQDFAPDSPENRLYLDYYAEMGMVPADARAFYDMTNSVGFENAKWLTAQDMRRWLGQDAAAKPARPAGNPVIAYLDLGQAIP